MGKSKQELAVEMAAAHDEESVTSECGAEANSLLDDFEQYLKTLNIALSDLETAGCNIAILRRLFKIETGPLKSRFPWLKLDFLFERFLMYPFLDKAGVTQADQAKSNLPSARLWVQGRGIPFKSRRTTGKAVAAIFFRSGLEMSALFILNTTFLSMLILQIANKQNVFDSYFSRNSSTIRDLIFLTASKYGEELKIAISSIALFPPFWGTCLAVWNAQRQMYHYKQPEIRRLLRNTRRYPTNLWHDLFRWLLPRPQLNEQFNQLQSLIRWNGDLDSPEQREALFNALTEHAGKRRGYSRIVLFWKIAELVQSPAFSQFDLIKDALSLQEIISLMKIKGQAFELIIRNQENAKTELLRSPGFFNSAYFTYLHYLQWALGDIKPKPSSVIFALYKLGKLGLSAYLFARFIQEVISYFSCPDALLDFQGRLPSVKHVLSQGCFDEVLKQFAIVPGEPIKILTDKLASFKLKGSIKIDLSNKELVTGQVITFLNAFAKQQSDVTINSIDLSGNNLNDADLLLKLLGLLSDVETLNFDQNNLGASNEAVTQFAQGLIHLPKLQNLTLTNNQLGQWDTDLTFTLIFLSQVTLQNPNLIYLDLSNNLIGGANVPNTAENINILQQTAEKLQAGKSSQLAYFNLSSNQFDLGSSLSSHMLAFALAPLSELTTLNLHNNFLGMHSTDGMVAFSAHLANKKKLAELTLSNNFIELLDSKGTEALGKALETTSSLKKINLTFNLLGKHDSVGLIALFKGLMKQTALETLLLRMNFIDLTDSQASTALHQTLRAFNYLKTLDLSMNELGRTDSMGVDALATSFVHLKGLETLSLENNRLQINTTPSYLAWKNLESLVSLTTLNIAGNQIGLSSTLGTKAIAKGIAKMPKITSIDLSFNALGSTGDEGVKAIANAIKGKYALDHFTIQPQEGKFNLGGVELNPTKALNELAMHMPRNKPLRLLTPNAIENYLNSFPPTQTALDLSGLFKAPSQLICLRMMQTIQKRFPNLTTFKFNNNYLGLDSYGLRAFALELSYLTALEQLELSNNFLSIHQQHEMNSLLMIALRDLSNLKILDLSQNFLGIQKRAEKSLGAAMLGLKNLETFNLYLNWIGFLNQNGLQVIGNSLPHLSSLKVANFSNNWMGLNDVRGLGAIAQGAAQLSHLQKIDFSLNPLGALTTNKLTQALSLSFNLDALIFANFSNCNIGMQGEGVIERFVFGLAGTTSLKTLDLSTNLIGSQDGKTTSSLSDALAGSTNLEKLTLANNFIGIHSDSTGPAHLGTALKQLVNLTELDLSGLEVVDEAMKTVLLGLQGMCKLRYLDLSATLIGCSQASSTALAQILPNFTDLLSLNLTIGCFGFGGVENTVTFANALAQLHQLDTLFLEGNSIGLNGDAGLVALSNSIQNIKNLSLFTFSPQYTTNLTPLVIKDSLIQSFNQALHQTKVNHPIVQPFISPEQVRNYLNFFPSNTTHFDFSGLLDISIDPLSISALMEGLGNFQFLNSLDLSNNNFGSNFPAIQSLATSFIFLPQLQRLKMNNNNLGALDNESIKAFSEGLAQLGSLREIELNHNKLGQFSKPSIVMNTLALLGLKQLSKLNNLDLSLNADNYTPSTALPVAGLAVAMKQLKQLSSLNLAGNLIGASPVDKNDVAKLMTTFAKLTKLTNLNLQNNFISLFSGSELAASLKQLINLQSLNLQNNLIRGALCQTVSSSLAELKHMQTLDLSLNLWGENSATNLESLANSLQQMPNLSSFNISRNFIGEHNIGDAEMIAPALSQRSNLTEFQFFPQNNPPFGVNFTSLKPIYETYSQKNLKIMSVEAMKYFLDKLGDTNILKTLNLANRLDAPSPSIIVEMLIFILSDGNKGLPALTTLNLAHDNLALSIEAFFDFTAFSFISDTLVHLNLTGNMIGLTDEQSTLRLAETLPGFSKLTVLDLSNNWLGSQGSKAVIHLAAAINKLTTLEQLYLDNNNLGYVDNTGTTALFAAFSSLTNLKILTLQGNNLGITSFLAFSALGNSFKTMKQLRYLNVAKNFLGFNLLPSSPLYNEQNNAFFAQLQHLNNLQVLDLSNNYIGQIQPNNNQNLAASLLFLPHLRCLHLAHNSLNSLPEAKQSVDVLLESLGQMSQLESLTLYGNQITFHNTNSGEILAKQNSDILNARCREYDCFNRTLPTYAPDCSVRSVMGASSTIFSDTSGTSRPKPLAIYRHVMTGIQKVTGWAKSLWELSTEEPILDNSADTSDGIDAFLDQKLTDQNTPLELHANSATFFAAGSYDSLLSVPKISNVTCLGR
jgi:Ran GTPase-activating protein (RanGAP) involved in mRNA processing and transport